MRLSDGESDAASGMPQSQSNNELSDQEESKEWQFLESPKEVTK